MMLALRDGRFFDGHGWWWGFFGGLVPLLFMVALIALGVWAVLRLTRGPSPVQSASAYQQFARPDGALEELRLRYARGEMSREEFLQRSRDLGGPEPRPGNSTPPPPVSV